ncbi:hypothetical protein DLP05_020 [Stenotrophomonas phage vB_SmaS_DLP_5]|uniref:Virion structural protein n=1 Tax=Stenotrophomonas phage vB_SmaS_DLP_5 TaxID=2044561 RepID=A0A2D2W2C7_9CAUD|nr:structural protein [Stenotrophomonas phage vB_SmaS_DLP_5]ATS92295.1 hypothetical protein DLP05_020 [Stenotrophomonas phage vB_SmaS_DLP_5]
MYLKGSAIDCTDLLAQLRTFLEGAGWTTDYYAPRSQLPDSGVQYSFHKGDLNVTMLSNVTEVENPITSSDKRGRVYVQIHDPFVASQTPEVQPNSTGNQMTNGLTDPIKNFWFFEGEEGGSQYAYVVCEITTGVFKHFHVGKLKKRGQTYENGNFVTCSNWYYNSTNITDQPDVGWHSVPFDDVNNSSNNYNGMVVRCDLGGVSPRWWRSNYYYSNSGVNLLRVGYRGGNDYGTIHALKDWGLSTETGRTPLSPLHTAINRGEGYYSYIGEPPGVRYIDITNYEGAQELAVGSDTWLVFPVHRKIFTSQSPYTAAYGLAYKKVID